MTIEDLETQFERAYTAVNDPLKLAIGHIEHMAAWISKNHPGQYSFEGLGEDFPDIVAGLTGMSADGSVFIVNAEPVAIINPPWQKDRTKPVWYSAEGENFRLYPDGSITHVADDSTETPHAAVNFKVDHGEPLKITLENIFSDNVAGKIDVEGRTHHQSGIISVASGNEWPLDAPTINNGLDAFKAACANVAGVPFGADVANFTNLVNAHDALIRLAAEHGFLHRPQFVTFYGHQIRILMCDGEQSASFWIGE